MRKFILGALVAMVLAACAKEETPIAKIEEVKNPYAVTPDEAVQLLRTVIGGETTRAVSIGDIKTLRKSDFVPTTRGGEDGDLIYIVDLENGGSAIMGADKRMEPIYAILDETKVSPEQLTLTATRSDDGEQDIKEYVMGLVNAKIGADASVLAFPEMPIIPRPQFWTETVVIAQQDPILTTKWDQGAPFNNNFPMKTSGLLRCPAGCTTVAAAQIMYYNKLPTSINGVVLDWDLISEYEYNYCSIYNPSPSATLEIANFMYIIAEGLNADYYLNNDNLGTGCTIENTVSFLSSVGYRNVTNSNYSLAYIETMLASNILPVFVFARTSDNEGHTWVIDGCNVYKVEHWERNYHTQFTYTDSIESIDQYNLVHCNYGWSGNCDGYYTSGIFDTTTALPSDLVDSDIGDYSCANIYNFNTSISIITYSLN